MSRAPSREGAARFFRVSRTGDRPLWNAIKTVAQSLALWAFFFAALPASIYAVESHTPLAGWRWTGCLLARQLGIAVFALLTVINLATGIGLAVHGHGTPFPLDTTQRLVISGPYRYIRNPMALGNILQGIALGVAVGSPAIVGYCLLGVPFWQLFVRPAEEADLEQRFGDEYRRYHAAVRCWFPKWKAYRLHE